MAVAPEPVAVSAPPTLPKGNADLRASLIAALEEMDRPFVVDNLELASIVEGNGEYIITAPGEAVMPLQLDERDLVGAAQKVAGKPMRIRIVEGVAAAQRPRGPSATASPKRSNEEEEALGRALADPAVQSFREAFPGAEIRQVRNLKD